MERPQRGVVWRADEIDLVTDAPIKPGGILTTDPGLDGRWWERLSASLEALATAAITRGATVHTELMTQDRLTNTITAVIDEPLDLAVEQWVPAHGDLNWANLTAPTCWVLDWEDWGLAPRGLDAAGLWVASLAVLTLAERVTRERSAELESRPGMLAALFFCCELLAAPPGYAGPLGEPVEREVVRLLTALTR